MTSEEIDMLLNKAIIQSIELGEDVVRYRFAALVAAAEREACELTVDSLIISGPVSEVQQRHNWAYMHARDAIRARGET